MSLEIGDFAAGFLHYQNAGGGVPRVQAELPEAVEASASYGCQIQCRRAVASHAVGSQRKIPVVVNIGIRMALAIRKSGAQQTVLHGRNFRAMDFFTIEDG